MKKEVKISIFILSALITFYFGVSYLSGNIGFSKVNKYYVIFESNNGLKTSSPVLFKGTQVGKVRNIEILHNDSYRVKIEFEVDSRVVLTEDTKVKMAYGNIIGIGNVSLSILMGEGEKIKKGSMVQGVVDYTISDAITPTIKSVEELLFHTNKFLLEIAKNTDKISVIFENLEIITNQVSLIIKRNESRFYNISNNISSIIEKMDSAEYGVGVALKEIVKLGKTINASEIKKVVLEFRNMITELKVLTQSVNSGSGTLGKMIASDEMYININNLLKGGESLLVDLKSHPGRYVSLSLFGSKSKNK